MERREPPQPAHDVRDVRAERTFVHVRLIDHHVLQVGEQRRPLRVIR